MKLSRLTAEEISLASAISSVLRITRRKHHIICPCSICRAGRALGDAILSPTRRNVRRKGSK